MTKRKLGRNRGVWCGTVQNEPVFSHEIVDNETDEVIETFYTFEIETEIHNKNNELIDSSTLPIVVSKTKLEELKEEISIGKIVFVKGFWRTYDQKDRTDSRLKQNVFAKKIELHTEYPVKTRNKFEFEGVLVKKLYKFKRDEDGKPLKDEEGRLIPKLDEEDNIRYTVRRNKEGKLVNDYIVAINRPSGSDYIPCLSYVPLGQKIAKEIEIGEEIKGSGYIRGRKYEDRNGIMRMAYEVVITRLYKADEEIIENGEKNNED